MAWMFCCAAPRNIRSSVVETMRVFMVVCVLFLVQRLKLSDPTHGTQRLQPRRSRRVRCSAWLGGLVKVGSYLCAGHRATP